MENIDYWKKFLGSGLRRQLRDCRSPYRSFHISQQDNPSVTLCVPKVLPLQGEVDSFPPSKVLPL